jgi:hypothetical protein
MSCEDFMTLVKETISKEQDSSHEDEAQPVTALTVARSQASKLKVSTAALFKEHHQNA